MNCRAPAVVRVTILRRLLERIHTAIGYFVEADHDGLCSGTSGSIRWAFQEPLIQTEVFAEELLLMGARLAAGRVVAHDAFLGLLAFE